MKLGPSPRRNASQSLWDILLRECGPSGAPAQLKQRWHVLETDRFDDVAGPGPDADVAGPGPDADVAGPAPGDDVAGPGLGADVAAPVSGIDTEEILRQSFFSMLQKSGGAFQVSGITGIDCLCTDPQRPRTDLKQGAPQIAIVTSESHGNSGGCRECQRGSEGTSELIGFWKTLSPYLIQAYAAISGRGHDAPPTIFAGHEISEQMIQVMINSTPEKLAQFLNRSFINKSRYDITLCLMRENGCIENLKYHPCDVRQQNGLLYCISMTLFRHWENFTEGIRLIQKFCQDERPEGMSEDCEKACDGIGVLLAQDPPGFPRRGESTQWNVDQEWRGAVANVQSDDSSLERLFTSTPGDCEERWWLRWAAAVDQLLRVCNATSPDGKSRPLRGDMFTEVEPHRALWRRYRELLHERLRNLMASSRNATARVKFLKYRILDDIICMHVDLYTVLSYLASDECIFVGHFGSFHSKNIVAMLRSVGFAIDIDLSDTFEITQTAARCMRLALAPSRDSVVA